VTAPTSFDALLSQEAEGLPSPSEQAAAPGPPVDTVGLGVGAMVVGGVEPDGGAPPHDDRTRAARTDETRAHEYERRDIEETSPNGSSDAPEPIDQSSARPGFARRRATRRDPPAGYWRLALEFDEEAAE
jgi:hypothetical protein